MDLITALLLAITATLACGRVWSPITWPFAYPLINGTITGIVLGDPMAGLLAGATINLAYIGWISAGGTMPSNIGIAGVYGTAITIMAKADPELAITLAVPIGLLGVLLWQLQMTVNAFWVHRLDANAEKGELNKVWINAALGPQLTALVINGWPAFVLIFLGGDFFVSMMERIPESLVNALTVVGGLLPALGVAMLLTFLGKRYLIPYFVIGFFLALYLQLDLMAIAVFGACMAALVYFRNPGERAAQAEAAPAEPAGEPSGEEGLVMTRRLRKSDLVRHWLIGLGAEIGYNYERMQASGNLLAMVHVIRRLYPDPEDVKAAMRRYLTFFNTEPSFVGPAIPGVAVALEERKANGADVSDESISAIRTGLMGPLAGVGDSLAGGIIYPILISIGCSLALNNGSFAGPAVFFVGFTGIMLVLGYNLYRMGYRQGGPSIMNILGEGPFSLTRVTDAFSVLGLMVIGAMGATRVIGYTPVQIRVGQTDVVLQDVLNGLIPGLIPFAIIMGIWWMLRRRINPTWIVVALMVLGIGGYYIGLLGVPPA